MAIVVVVVVIAVVVVCIVAWSWTWNNWYKHYCGGLGECRATVCTDGDEFVM